MNGNWPLTKGGFRTNSTVEINTKLIMKTYSLFSGRGKLALMEI